jgi:hypothetical protein
MATTGARGRATRAAALLTALARGIASSTRSAGGRAVASAEGARSALRATTTTTLQRVKFERDVVVPRDAVPRHDEQDVRDADRDGGFARGEAGRHLVRDEVAQRTELRATKRFWSSASASASVVVRSGRV